MDIKVRMPGTIISYEVKVGEQVRAGDTLAFMEAMKLKHRIVSPLDGYIAEILVPVHKRISAGTLIIRLEVGG